MIRYYDIFANLYEAIFYFPDNFPIIFLISGTLPAEATLCLKQLTLFGMISRRPEKNLNKIALIISDEKDKSWIGHICTLFFKYSFFASTRSD